MLKKSASLYLSSLSAAVFSFIGTGGRRRGIDWMFSSRVFLVLWKARKPSTLAQPTNPPTHIEKAPLDPLCSPGRASLPRSGARTPSCGRQPLTEWQPSLIQRRDLNLGSKQHLLLKHARSASMGNFSLSFDSSERHPHQIMTAVSCVCQVRRRVASVCAAKPREKHVKL